jgi:hypothetical protein
MPLLNGHTQNIIDSNIKELIQAGHKQNQAVAISLKLANKSRAGSKDK